VHAGLRRRGLPGPETTRCARLRQVNDASQIPEYAWEFGSNLGLVGTYNTAGAPLALAADEGRRSQHVLNL
jgi:hypothetical protein